MASDTNDIFAHPTYFTLLLEYFEIKFTFSTIILLSKSHLNFIKNNKNKRIIQRLITSQIGKIFEISNPFNDHYFNSNTNSYELIIKFYTDFGYIEQIAFPQHHKNMMEQCLNWKKESEQIDWNNAEIIEDEENYYNPFDDEYNAIKYNKIPFDFDILLKLENAEFIIFWIHYILNQKHIDFGSDLECIFFYGSAFRDRAFKYTVTAINKFGRIGGGYPFDAFLIRNICYWPLKEFEKMIQFIFSKLSTLPIDTFLTMPFASFLMYFDDKNKQIDGDKFRIYMNEFSKHKSVKNAESMDIITAINGPFGLYGDIFHVIWVQYKDSVDILQEAKDNKTYQSVFGQIGQFLTENVHHNDLLNYFEKVRTDGDYRLNQLNHLNLVDHQKYHQLFLQFLQV